MKRILVFLVLLIGLGIIFSQGGSSEPEAVIWTGPTITFEKADGADPTDEANQDRITENVWITRANGGNQIYNIAIEARPNARNSPEGTLWAQGTTAEIDSLRVLPFRTAVRKPKDVVGKNLVLYIPGENIYIDIVFTSWSTGKKGGFAYERSTPSE
jgi:hypothetical protein